MLLQRPTQRPTTCIYIYIQLKLSVQPNPLYRNEQETNQQAPTDAPTHYAPTHPTHHGYVSTTALCRVRTFATRRLCIAIRMDERRRRAHSVFMCIYISRFRKDVLRCNGSRVSAYDAWTSTRARRKSFSTQMQNAFASLHVVFVPHYKGNGVYRVKWSAVGFFFKQRYEFSWIKVQKTLVLPFGS